MITIISTAEKFAWQNKLNRNNIAIGTQDYNNDYWPKFSFKLITTATVTALKLFRLKTISNSTGAVDTNDNPVILDEIILNAALVLKTSNLFYFNGLADTNDLNGYYYYYIEFSDSTSYKSEVFEFGDAILGSPEGNYSPPVIDTNFWIYKNKTSSFTQVFLTDTFINDVQILCKENNSSLKIGTTLNGSEVMELKSFDLSGDVNFWTINTPLETPGTLYFTITGKVNFMINYEILWQ